MRGDAFYGGNFYTRFSYLGSKKDRHMLRLCLTVFSQSRKGRLKYRQKHRQMFRLPWADEHPTKADRLKISGLSKSELQLTMDCG
jgi:hypothetical protein